VDVVLRSQSGELVEAKGVIQKSAGALYQESDTIPPGVDLLAVRLILTPTVGTASGYLFLRAVSTAQRASEPSLRQVTIAGSPSAIATTVLGISFIVALGCVLVGAALLLFHAVPLGGRMGAPTWDFSKSWANNLTVLTSIVATVLAFGFLPQQTVFLSRSGYLALNSLLVMLLGFAPILFGLIRVPLVTPLTPGTDPQYQGIVGGFVASCLITLWAVLAQLIVIGLLIEELRWATIISRSTAISLEFTLSALAVALIAYATESVYFTAKGQHVPAIDAKARLSAAALGPVILPAWSAL